MPSQVYKAIIVDDEKHAIDYLAGLLSEEPSFRILGTASSVKEAIPIIKHHNPDVLFLDILMPDGDGFSVANAIKNLNNIPRIVFVTAFEDFALKAIKHEAFDYLLKPVKPEDIQTLIQHLDNSKPKHNYPKRLEMVLDRISHNKKLRFPTRTGFVVINCQDIMFCKAYHNYTEIYPDTGDKVVVTVNLSEIEQLLPEDIFLRISRSSLINMTFVASFERTKRQCTLNKDDIIIKAEVPYARLKYVESKLTRFIDKY